MTLSKPIQGTYDPNYDPRPKTVCIGVSLITVETDSFIQDDRHVEIPVDDEVIYLTADYNIVYTANGGADYSKIALLAEKAGWSRRHWKVMSVWTVVPETQQPF